MREGLIRLLRRCSRRGCILGIGILVCISFQITFLQQSHGEDNHEMPAVRTLHERRRHSRRVVYLEEAQMPSIRSKRRIKPLSGRLVFAEHPDFLKDQPWSSDNCSYPVDWQRVFHPTCNRVHETTDPGNLEGFDDWRQTWSLNDQIIIKRSKLNHMNHNRSEFSLEMYKSQVEVMALDRMSASSIALDVYGFCGASILLERADERLETWFSRLDLTSKISGSIQKLKLGRDVARIMSEIHLIDHIETLAVAEFTLPNLLMKNNSVKIRDFNQAILMKSEGNSTCRYRREVLARRGLIQLSPEERKKYKKYILPIKRDIFQLGNILYQILTQQYHLKFRFRKDEGYIKTTPRSLLDVPDPIQLVYHERALYYAFLVCHAPNPIQRPDSDIIWRGLERAAGDSTMTDEELKRLFDVERVLLK